MDSAGGSEPSSGTSTVVDEEPEARRRHVKGPTIAPLPMSRPPSSRRRQVGADDRTAPIPSLLPHEASKLSSLGRFALTVTALSWLVFVGGVVHGWLAKDAHSAREAAETVIYVGIVTLLTLSAAAYLVSRQGYLRRVRRHVRAPRAEIEAQLEDNPPTVTVLIPSFKEEPEVILQTMVSAALQEYPGLEVVLLIDDPSDPADEEDRRKLTAAREMPARIMGMLATPRRRFEAALKRAEAKQESGRRPTRRDITRLAGDYELAASSIEDIAAHWDRRDHTDAFFVDHVLRNLARDLATVAAAVHGSTSEKASMDGERYVQLHRRLTSTFAVDVRSFERKRHPALPADASKAMNLNCYIGLMGHSFIERTSSAGDLLFPCTADDPAANLHIRRPDYIVTLDADSVLLPEYCLRIVHLMEQPGNERVGVGQTPYSAFPGAPTRVERLAGATTDLQYIVHQGMAEHDAAYWVGANAVLRTDAVEELRTEDDKAHNVSRFISDRTVIEDTESTLDLAVRGWTVANYPERLAYSASPPDFGSLCVQRQRWANGGLIIARKLATCWRAKKARGERRDPVELLLRLNYLASITWATVGLVLLLAYPFSGGLVSGIVILLSAPYFIVQASDLKRCGYKRTDVFRIYGFNLIMLPVNASGVLRSIGQIVTGHKVAFARTPKVRHRSLAPASFIIFAYLLVALSIVALLADLHSQRWAHAVFAGANVLIAAPAIIAMIGLRNSVRDLWSGAVAKLYTPARQADAPATLDPVLDWAAVLYHGSVDEPRGLYQPALTAQPVAAVREKEPVA